MPLEFGAWQRFLLRGKGRYLLCFACARKKRRRAKSLASLCSFCKSAQFISLLNKFNTDAVRTSSVARVGVGKGAGAPRNSERRPLTSIAHNAVKR